MRYFFGVFDYLDLADEANGEDWAIPLEYVPEPAPLLTSFLGKQVYETTETSFSKVLQFIQRSYRNPGDCCAILALPDREWPSRETIVERAVNLNGVDFPQFMPDAGECWIFGRGLYSEHQPMYIPYEVDGEKFTLLALDRTDDDLRVWILGDYGTVERLSKELPTLREEYRQRAEHSQQEAVNHRFPAQIAVDACEPIQLHGGDYFYPGQDSYQGRFVRLHLDVELPEGMTRPVVYVGSTKNTSYTEGPNGEEIPRPSVTPPHLPCDTLTLKFSERMQEHFIGKPFIARPEGQDDRIEYLNPNGGEPLYFYLEGYQAEDVCKDVTDEKLRRAFRQHLPEDQWLLALVTENPFPEMQLQFERKKKLDAPPQHCSSSTFWLLHSDGTGIHGFPCRRNALGSVPAGFHEEVEVELYSVMRHLPAYEDMKIQVKGCL